MAKRPPLLARTFSFAQRHAARVAEVRLHPIGNSVFTMTESRMCKASSVLIAASLFLSSSLWGQEADEERPSRQRIEIVTNSIGMEFVRLAPGSFVMGSPEKEAGRRTDEAQRKVTLSRPFMLGRYEVTREQFVEVLTNARPWSEQPFVGAEPNAAATYVSYQLARAFCKTLTDREHRARCLPANEIYRLPTEAEWEYACRAGGQSTYFFGNDGSELNYHAWFGIDRNNPKQAFARSVGKKKANAWGLHDTHGNVCEWCLDVYQEELPGGKDPFVASGGPFRVFRGGSWRSTENHCRSANRDRYGPAYTNSAIGLRVARVQEPVDLKKTE